MGKKAKTSRKGKKAWRANISTEGIEDYYEKSTKNALSGGSLTDVPTDSLFFVDKTQDLSVRRKIEQHREKVLHCDSILLHNKFVQPVPSSLKKRNKKHKKVPETNGATQSSAKDGSLSGSCMTDIWGNEGECDSGTKKAAKPSVIPAVEVEPPGCSFNPSFDAHQDALAQAVAEEMRKVYKDELGPQPVPLTVPGQMVEEEDMYFLDVDNGNDDINEEENEDSAQEKREFDVREIFNSTSIPKKRVTRVEFNRRARRKDQQKKEAESKKKEGVSKEIDCLPEIIKEIAKDDEQKERRHIRRAVAKQERLRTRPPRLGKHRFEPAPVQVLLSEEITGSLRKIKGCCNLVKDRFKSIEKRGLIAPTGKGRRK